MKKNFEEYFLELFKPREKMTISEWADKYRMLSSESSSEAGKWRTDRAEYQREIMDTFSRGDIHTVILMSSSQIGKTELLLNILGFFMHYEPAPILALQPTLDMAQTFSKDRLMPMIRDTKELSSALPDFKSRASGNTILHKQFAGGHITMAGANSPASLASRPIRVVLADEVDRYPASAGAEGDPLNLAFKRTTTFWDKKRMVVSTPTIKGESRIEMAYEQSDKRKFYAPCHACNHYQVLKWSNVTWEDNKPQSAKYVCDKCGVMWDDIQRWNAVSKGEWRAQLPTNGIAGFWLNEIYSPWVKLEDMVKNFLEAKKSPHTLKTFINTSLGETWEDDQGAGLEHDVLYARREIYEHIPNKALVLTCGVDVQDDRLEGEVKAWGDGEESWGVKPFVIYGRPSLPKVWQDLDDIILSSYKREDGLQMRVLCTCIDSGGHFTQDVYKYCKAREANRVFAIKGSSIAGKPVVSRPSTSNKQKIKLFSIGVDTAKELIYSRLQIEEFGNGYMHFNKEFDEEYFKQLTAEKIKTTYHKGFAKREWVKTRARNEAIDYTVYNLAALALLNPNFKALLAKKDKPAKPKRKIEKGWVNGWKNR